ncbi:hypothetical protein DFH11DRAFT_972176 [Phellopilus nigrolimitatus]|nr:hypothetical protein DFH11DRAFT_972176 [Phellopilus nigrolimitatus]
MIHEALDNLLYPHNAIHNFCLSLPVPLTLETNPCFLQFFSPVVCTRATYLQHSLHRKRPQQLHYQQYAHASNAMPSPSGSSFPHDLTGSSISILLGLGTETQVRQPDSQEPGSLEVFSTMSRVGEALSVSLAICAVCQRSI